MIMMTRAVIIFETLIMVTTTVNELPYEAEMVLSH
jgi:hypothetical protein